MNQGIVEMHADVSGACLYKKMRPLLLFPAQFFRARGIPVRFDKSLGLF